MSLKRVRKEAGAREKEINGERTRLLPNGQHTGDIQTINIITTAAVTINPTTTSNS